MVVLKTTLADSGVTARGISSAVALDDGVAVLVHAQTRDELVVVDADRNVDVAIRPHVEGCRGESVEPLIEGISPELDSDKAIAVLSCFGWNPNEVELWSFDGTDWAKSDRDRLFLGSGITVDSDRVGDSNTGFDLVYDRDEFCAFDAMDATAPTCGPWSDIDRSCRMIHDVIRLSADATGALVVYDSMIGPVRLARLIADGDGFSGCETRGRVSASILGPARAGHAAMFIGGGDGVVNRVGDESNITYRFVDESGGAIEGLNGVTSAVIDGCDRIVLTAGEQIGVTECVPAARA